MLSSMNILFICSIIFVLSIQWTESLSREEDLSIRQYFHVGCLRLMSNKSFLLDQQHETILLPYQTFFSPMMTIDLCFRLCRRWIILVDTRRTHCICLFTINKPYELSKHLGDVLSIAQCSSSDLRIYSLTKDFYPLPSPSPTDDWSLDGCYYLHGIQTVRANLKLDDLEYNLSMDMCRKHCQIYSTTNYFSFFLSSKKSCYCLPMKLSAIILPLALRKPLIHCSFVPYIKSAFQTSWNLSDTHSDTVVKIDVQRYCSSTFIFDRNFYLCLKFVSLDTFNTYEILSDGVRCVPLVIQTYEQWIYLTSFSFLLRTRTFIWIDRNSTYLFDELFKTKIHTYSLTSDLCLIVNRTNSSRSTSFDLVPCATALMSDYILCAQRPIKSLVADDGQIEWM
jgi:hypothetical protein